MSSYEYTHTSGSSLLIRDSSYPDRILLRVGFNNSKEGMHIPSADVPTVAAELLKAAGQESVIVPKSTAWVREEGGVLICGSVAEIAWHRDAESFLTKAAECVAIAEFIKGKAAREAAEKAEAEAAEKKLQERRDALTQKFSSHPYPYSAVSPTARNAIDAYIELQDKLDGASRD